MIQNMGCVESFLSATLRKALSCNVDVAEPFMFRMLRVRIEADDQIAHLKGYSIPDDVTLQL
jgi:hypothetical protein